jgi:hypothetical protein
MVYVLKPMKTFTMFSTNGVSNVKNFKFISLGVLCVFGLIIHYPFVDFCCELVQVVFLILVVNFFIFSSHLLAKWAMF